MTDLAALIPLALIALLFWFMVVRPASKRQRKMAAVQTSVSPGDRVMLASGLFGVVRDIGMPGTSPVVHLGKDEVGEDVPAPTPTKDDEIGIEIADGVVVRVVRGAIVSVQGPDEQGPDEQGSDLGSEDHGTDEQGQDEQGRAD